MTFAEPMRVEGVKIWNRSGFEGRIDNANLIFKNNNKVVSKHVLKAGGSTSGMDPWISSAFNPAMNILKGQKAEPGGSEVVKTHLKGNARKLFIKGKEIYLREGHCGTCHQEDGNGLVSSGFPPLSKTKWALGSEDRLIKLTLKGLMGKITVKGKEYPGHVPMTPFEGLLNDEEIASVLTYVRNSFGNKASVITPKKVKSVRAEVNGKVGFYLPEELLKIHPSN